MKKTYNSPVIEIIEMEIQSSILKISLLEGNDGAGDTQGNKRGHSEFQKDNEFRSDWDNIWGNM